MKTEKFDVAIIGSGLGGLLCGSILSNEGFRVCVIEKNKKTGGCIQIFSRDKCIFNTGLNYTEGLAEGQILNRYFKYFGLIDKLKLRQMDQDGFEIITFQGKEYKLAQGEQNFIDTLSQYFPEERHNIETFIEEIKKICEQFPLYNLEFDEQLQPNYDELFSKSAYEFLCSITSNDTLRNILAGNNLLYAGVKEKTPLYLYALTTYTFISSAWRITDGSQKIATFLAENITAHNGIIYRDCKVEKLSLQNKLIEYAETSDGNRIEATHFISNIHPSNTLDLIDPGYPGSYQKRRIHNLENTISMFTVYGVFEKDTFPYLNHNHHYFEKDSVWTIDSYSEESWPESFLFYTPSTSKSDRFADGFIVMTYMKWEEMKPWENTTSGNRGSDYLTFKEEKVQKLLNLVEKKFPGIQQKIRSYYSSTPLTWRDYTGTPQGSAYGIQKDFNEPFQSMIMPRTKIPNLFFTGQNLKIHGILGVSVAAIMTCGEIIGIDNLIEKVKKHI